MTTRSKQLEKLDLRRASSQLLKTMSDIERMKKKIFLTERWSQIHLEKSQHRCTKNKKLINHLSENNLTLRKKFFYKRHHDYNVYLEHFPNRPKSEILSLRNKSLVGIKTCHDENNHSIKNRYNIIVFERNQKSIELDKLKEALDDCEKLQQDDKDINEKKKFLENKLDAIKQKLVLSKEITKIYKKVVEQLKHEIHVYPHTLNELQKEEENLMEQRLEFASLGNHAFETVGLALKRKQSLEEKFKAEKLSRNSSMKQLEEQIYEKVESSLDFHQFSEFSLKKRKKSEAKKVSFKEICLLSKMSSTAIADYENKADLINNATGVSIWNKKKMVWCLSNQKERSEKLKKQKERKLKDLKSFQATKDRLRNELEVVKCHKNTRYMDEIKDCERALSKLENKIGIKKQLFRDKSELIWKVRQILGFLGCFITKKIINHRFDLELPQTDPDAELDSLQSDLDFIQKILPKLYDVAQKLLNDCNITANEALEDSNHTSKRKRDVWSVLMKGMDCINCRIVTAYENSIDEFVRPELINEDYVSRAHIKKRMEYITRGKKRLKRLN